MKVIILVATTLDGKIAKSQNQLTDWTSKADKKVFIEVTKKAGVVVIGKPLPGRLNVILDLNPNSSKNIPGLLEFTNMSPKELLKSLKNRGFKEVIIGGGAIIYSLFLKEGLIDEIWLTIEPKIFGKGLSIFKNIDTNINLKLISTGKLDENVLHLKYKIVK